MTIIHYVRGDATEPRGDGHKIIVHCCNDIGAWGAGFVLAISKKWPHVEDAYRALGSYALGDVQFVKATEDITVANIIGQHGIGGMSRALDSGRKLSAGYRDKHPPIRYEAIEQGLRVVRYRATNHAHLASVHMPRMGCGLAGGSWDTMEPIIAKALQDLEVTVYDF